MKFWIEYKRTVRVRKYTTFTMGIRAEFDDEDHSYLSAFKICKGFVNGNIMLELKWLQGEGEE